MLDYEGVHLPLVSICAIDPAVKLIWCSGMAGISAWWMGGSICLWYLYVQ